MLFRYLAVGDRVRVVGKQTVDKETEILKYKALEVLKIGQPVASNLPSSTSAHSNTSAHSKPGQKKAKVLVCQKSACRKRGSKAVCQALEAALSEAGLEQSVSIKLTGCMDRCKAGPNVVVMPDKTRYTRVTPKQVSTLVSKHFGHTVAPQ